MTGLAAGIAFLALAAATPPAGPAAPGTAAAAPAACSGTVKYYVVPASAANGKLFLFEVALATLGSGSRYPEILGLNVGRRQPDGGRLDDPATALHPGWILRLPGGARGSGVRCGTSLPAAAGVAAPTARPTATHRPAQPARPARPAPAGPSLPAIPIVAAGTGAAALLAGLAASIWLARPLLGRLRRLRLRGRLPVPAWWRRRAAARRRDAHALLLASDPDALAAVDAAFRALSRISAGTTGGRPRPYAVEVDRERVTLHLAPVHPEPPAPWQTPDGGSTWCAPRRLLHDLPAGPELPASDLLLVTAGVRGDARVLVDLGRAPGVVCVDGEAVAAGALVAAMAAELAAPRSSARAVPVEHRLDALETRPEQRPAVEDEAAAALTGRRTERQGNAARALLALAEQPPRADAERLLALAGSPEARLTVLMAGTVPAACWRWTPGPAGGLDLGPLGLALETHVGELAGAGPALPGHACRPAPWHQARGIG